MFNPSEDPFNESTNKSCGPPGLGATPPPPRQQQRNDFTPLAKFVVKAPVRGVSVVRPPTLFPIVTTISNTESTSYKQPDVPIAPQQSGMDPGLQRNNWAPSSSGDVDRRYSELVDLRAIFVYQFPTIIVPPLPPKSKLESIDTYMTNGSVLVGQQQTIARFLREVAITPELIYFSVFTPNFFQLPREAFEGWFATARSVLENFRHCNASIEAYSTRRSGILSSGSVAAITDTSTRAVRKFVGFLHSWLGGASAEGPAPAPAAPPPALKQRDEQHRSNNIGENAADHIRYWKCALHFLENLRDALVDAARLYLTHLEQSFEMVAAEKEVSAALGHYAAVLAASPANAELAKVTREATTFTSDASMGEEALLGQNKREMHGRLLFEVSYLEAAMDAVDHVLCLWSNCEGLAGDHTYRENVAYTRAVSERLRDFYETRFLRNFRFRMHEMIERNANTSLKFAVTAEKKRKSADIMHTIADPKYLVFQALMQARDTRETGATNQED